MNLAIKLSSVKGCIKQNLIFFFFAEWIVQEISNCWVVSRRRIYKPFDYRSHSRIYCLSSIYLNRTILFSHILWILWLHKGSFLLLRPLCSTEPTLEWTRWYQGPEDREGRERMWRKVYSLTSMVRTNNEWVHKRSLLRLIGLYISGWPLLNVQWLYHGKHPACELTHVKLKKTWKMS